MTATGEGLGGRRQLMIGLSLIAMAALLRFWGLAAQGLWLDEATTWRRIGYPLRFLIENVAANDAHPPAYYIMLRLLTLPFTDLLPVEWSLRWPSALAAVGTVVLVWRLERRLQPTAPLPWATVLVSFSAFLVYYGQEARHYAFVGLWVTWGTLVLAAAVADGKPQRRQVLSYFVVTSLALYSFYYSAFFVAAHAAAVLSSGVVRRENWRSWLVFLTLPVIGFACYLPVTLAMKAKLAAAGSPLGFYLPGWDLMTELTRHLLLGPGPLPASAGALQAFVCLSLGLAAGVVVRGYRQLTPTQRIVLPCVMVPVVCFVLLPMKPHRPEAKHLLPLAVMLSLLIAQAFEVARGLRTWYPAAVLAVVAALLIAGNASALGSCYGGRQMKEDWRAAAVQLTEQVQHDDLILPAPFYLGYPLEIYLPAGLHAQLTDLEALYENARAAGERQALETSLIRRAPTIWLVELLNSPVSYIDPLSLEVVRRRRHAATTTVFPGRLGDIRVTAYQRNER